MIMNKYLTNRYHLLLETVNNHYGELPSSISTCSDKLYSKASICERWGGTRLRFTDLLNSSICEGLKNVLGESGMQAILFYVGLNQSSEPDEFHKQMRFIFGVGAISLEKVIVRELYSKLNMPYDESGEFDFARYVNRAREQYESIPLEMEKSD